MKILFVVVATALLMLLLSSQSSGDSLSFNGSVADHSLPSYGFDLEKDWDITYLDFQNMTTADSSSTTSTLALGLNMFNVNFGILGGYKVESLRTSGLGGVELGFTAPLTGALFLKENNQITRSFVDNATSGSLTLGLGLNL